MVSIPHAAAPPAASLPAAQLQAASTTLRPTLDAILTPEVTPLLAPTSTLGAARRGGDTPEAIQPAGDAAASLRDHLLGTVFTAQPVAAGEALAALDQHNGSAQVTDSQVLQQRLQATPTINTLIPVTPPAVLPATAAPLALPAPK